MTQAERQSIIFSALAAIRGLTPKESHAELDQHLDALTAAFNDQVEFAYDTGSQAAAATIRDEAYGRGKVDGMLAMESRTDRRDLAVIEAPAELRSVH